MPVIPDGTLTVRNSLEIFVEWFVGFIEGLLGHKGRTFVHVYGTFFLFILAANLIGLLPGFAPPTSNFNVTFALGVTSFLVYNYYGFRAKGVGYLKHFLGPIWWLAFLMLPLELIDNFVRPVSLALRLFGNMTGDHLVLEIFTGPDQDRHPGGLLCARRLRFADSGVRVHHPEHHLPVARAGRHEHHEEAHAAARTDRRRSGQLYAT